MLIQISRIYINSGDVYEILINPRYIKRIEPSYDLEKPKTRIVMDGGSEDNILYTNESMSSIRGKITKMMNKLHD